ncbi:hypothetical protein [Arthrobacter sp. NPDC090010]|uniref:hypothetical protein n=1 Tax=Arthrobacter sp. NPDC090010 TaxID=3363942 RepID=UPI0038253270
MAAPAKRKPKEREPFFGYETPRIWTPPLRPLEPRTAATEQHTLGYQVIDFATDILEVTLYPWQRWLLIHMLELTEDGALRFQVVVVLVARQNGKSMLSQVLALWFMMMKGWESVLGTAQDLETAEDIWQGAVEIIEDDEELKTFLRKVSNTNGKKFLELTNGSKYKVKAANRKAGRGLHGNLIMLDELREQQNWDAWGAITKTTRAQLEKLIFCLSNAGDATSVVLRYLRRMAHEVLGDPDGICQDMGETGPTALELADIEDVDVDEIDEDDFDDFEQDPETLAIFEWSAAPNKDKRDREGWKQSNPSAGWNPALTEQQIASECRTDPEWVFRIEVLCQWSDGGMTGPFPPGAWEKGKNVPVEREDGTQAVTEADRLVGPVVVGLHQSLDRRQTFVAFGGHRVDGTHQIEIVAMRRGSAWVKDWLMDPKRRHRIIAVTGQAKGAPVSPLIADLTADREFDIPVTEWMGTDLTTAWAEVLDAVRDATVRHNPQPVLDLAAANAVEKVFSGGAKLPDQKASPVEIASLLAFTAALWLLGHQPPPPQPPPPPPQALAPDTAPGLGALAAVGNIQSVGF